MLEQHPASTRPLKPGAAPPMSWADARQRLEESQFYWLATVRPDGLPHVMPVLAIWQDGALLVSTGPATRKGRNLEANPRCVVTVDSDDVHLVVEGEAARVYDETRLQRVAEAYAAKYGWEVHVRGGALYGDGAPTAGPPPYIVYAIRPGRAFGLGTDDSYRPTRWRFARAAQPTAERPD